ncbi:MAG: ABC transporter permease [Chloroflexi bacterium]|nr:ABC transporter permease [Chloroflexota bacterium]
MNSIKSFFAKHNLLLIVVVMFAGCSVYNASFLSKLNLTGMMVEISYMTMLTIGMTFVILTGGIDLSVGALAGLSTVIIARVLRDTSLGSDGFSTLMAILLAVLSCGIIGYVNGLLITLINISPLIVTLGMTWVTIGLSNTLVKGKPIALQISFLKNVLAYRIGTWVPVMTIVALVALVIAIYLLAKTKFGRSFYAVGSSIYAAHISGINTQTVLLMAYLISGLC